MATDAALAGIDFTTHRVLTIIDRLYESTREPGQWRVALSQIVEFFDGFAGSLVYFENSALHTVDLSFSVLHGLDPAGLSEYRRHVLRDVRFPALVRQPWHPGPRSGLSEAELASFMHGTPFTDRMVVNEKALRRSEFYRHVLQPHGIEYSLMAVDFEFDDATFTLGDRGFSLAVFRRPRDPAFDRADCARMRLLVAHIKRAVDIHTAVERLRSERNIAFTWLNQLAMGSVILDRRGEVIFANAIAREIADAADGFELSSGRFHIHDRGARQQFENLLATDLTTQSTAINLPRTDGRHALQLRVVGLAGLSADQSPAEAGLRAAFIARPGRTDQFRTGALRALYGLTEAEAQVAAALATGASVQRIALDRQVGTAAVRFHLKNVYQKTGTHRQAELVQRILSNPFWQSGPEAEPLPDPPY